MLKSTKPVVLICLTHGFHVRNIIYSDLYAHFCTNYRVLILMSDGNYVPSVDNALISNAEVVRVRVVPHRLERYFIFFRKSIFSGRERTQTYNLINENERKKHPIAYKLADYCNFVLGRLPLFANLWRAIEAVFVTGSEFNCVLEREKPLLVLTANYGTEGFEIRLLRAAHRHRVPTLAIVPSWDNLSSKGVIGAYPDHLVVWNQIMRDEAISLYGFKKDHIHVCGALQFDLYANPVNDNDFESVFSRFNFDRSTRYIVIGTITPRYFPNNIDMIEIIERAIDSGHLPNDLKIVVRLHPQVVDDPVYGDDLERYHQLAARSARIVLSIPRILRWGQMRPPAPTDAKELMMLLKSAVVCVMPASTLAIDACALGTPVIGIGFDGHSLQPYKQSVRRMYDFTHYRRLVAERGIRIAESAESLICEISSYLEDRERDKVGRQKIVASHVGNLAGASWRCVSAIADRLALGAPG